ncbi:MAG: thiamine pyrophosphate-binding protein [Thermorudis peleae]|nr:thiamine pyrophosphate-binding protein [Thermorudis peleae]
MVTVAQAVASELRRAGIDRAFGLPGGEVLYLIDALRQAGVPFVLCRHEASAGIMASVYGKLRGTAGVAVATLGPGAANLMLALATAWLDREPLLAITADLPTSWPPSHTHQRLPLLDLYRPITKHAEAVTPLNAASAVRRALAACCTEPLGPSYLMLSAEDAQLPAAEQLPDGQAAAPQPEASQLGDPDAAAQAIVAALAQAERPLVLVGLGMRPTRATLLRRWLDTWGLPVAVTPKVKGIVDETAPYFVGVIGGMAIDDLMLQALEAADCLIGFGFDPVEVDKSWHARLPILWVLESAQATGQLPRSNAYYCDHGQVLERLVALEPPRAFGRPFAAVQAERQAIAAGHSRVPQHGLAPVALVQALARVLPPETIVTTDVGSHKYLFGQFWPSRFPQTFWMSNGLSGMGYGLPAAIGAKLARPDAPVLAVVGDGGFAMNGQELETARRLGAPVIVVVIADQSYSLIQISQSNRGLPRYGVDFGPIDSVAVARACGGDGERAATPEAISAAARRALDMAVPYVIEVPLDPEAYRPIV